MNDWSPDIFFAIDSVGNWKTYGFTQMNFWDHCAKCGLEVAKSKVADLRESIDPEAVQVMKNVRQILTQILF